MLQSVDSETRLRMEVAPTELINPTKKVVRMAMKKVERFGKLGEYDFVNLFLEKTGTGRLYRITRTGLNVSRDQEGIVTRIETKDPNCGLFVECMERKGGRLIELSTIQLPQDPNLVNLENIFILRGISPESMGKLAEDLLDTTPAAISLIEYSRRKSISF